MHLSSFARPAHYERIIHADQLSEEAYQKLMSAYAGRHMRSAALAVYEKYKQTLWEEMHIEPDEATKSLYRKILDSL